MTILVTGATGTVGERLVHRLSETGARVRALTRNPANAKHLPGDVEVCEGNLHDRESLRAALDGVERMYLFSDADTVHNVTAAASAAGVARLVALMSAKDDNEPESGGGNPIEQAVRAMDVEWTFLRPGPFAMNARDWWARSIREHGVVRWVYPDARLAPIHEADVADAACAALTQDGHVGREYVLSGPQALTQAEQVRVIAERLGREIPYHEITPDEGKEMLLGNGVPAQISDWLMATLGSLVGTTPSDVDQTVESLTGLPARTFADWVAEHENAFKY